jgi:hypothetical protein
MHIGKPVIAAEVVPGELFVIEERGGKLVG